MSSAAVSTKAPSTKPKQRPFWHQLTAGGIAGVSEILVMYPLDVVKTRAQLQVGGKTSMIGSLIHMIKHEGGILPPILAEAPKRAVKFTANERYRPLFADKDGKLGVFRSTLAGIAAGVTEAFVVVPFELVKIRLQAKENAGLYKNTLDAVIKIIRHEGPFALYKGLEPTLWRHAAWNGGYFGVIDYLRKVIPEPKSGSNVQKTLRDFVVGALAGTFGTILNTPPDVAKSRIQNQDALLPPGAPRPYKYTIPSMFKIAREEGIPALYKGFIPKVLRLGPGGGILLVVFKAVMDALEPYA